MAGEIKTAVPLNGTNYATWKLQCRMVLMKDGVWTIVTGTETAPGEDRPEARVKFMVRRDRALATIVLSMDPSLLYLIGDEPKDPKDVWTKLQEQFQRKTWANKLSLRRKLYSLKLRDRESVQQHIKSMTEIFNELSVVGDPISEEDRVVRLLASLPESYSVLVTALEASSEVPKMAVVIERLLHEESKVNDRPEDSSKANAMTSRHRRRASVKCYHCKRFGHVQKNCPDPDSAQNDKLTDIISRTTKKGTMTRQKVNQLHVVSSQDYSSEDSDVVTLMVRHLLPTGDINNPSCGDWIVDSGATCHICNDLRQFVSVNDVAKPIEVVVGDGRALKASKSGVVELKIQKPNGQMKLLHIRDALFVPELSYSLLSVPKATENGATITFDGNRCRIFDQSKAIVTEATQKGKLYYLKTVEHIVNAAVHQHPTKETLWHRRYAHLSSRNLQTLSRKGLVSGFDFDHSKQSDFCESCTEGKHHRSAFTHSSTRRAKEPLELIHSDVCGRLSESSLGGAQYFVTFIDDCTRYVWVYLLKSKSEVLCRFKEWKTRVERSSGLKLKAIRTDNGGEYTSTEFQDFLKSEGVRHERTVPKSPEQNGESERMNRTLMECVRAMLSDSKLPKKFWGEALGTATYIRN